VLGESDRTLTTPLKMPVSMDSNRHWSRLSSSSDCYVWYGTPDRAGIYNLFVKKFSVQSIVFGLIVILGLVSRGDLRNTRIILLVEIMCALPLERDSKIDITVVALLCHRHGSCVKTPREPLFHYCCKQLSGAPIMQALIFSPPTPWHIHHT